MTEELIKIEPKKDVSNPDRLTIITLVHHESFDEEPCSVEARCGYLLKGHEEPYFRRIQLRPNILFFPENDSWVDKPDCVVVHNVKKLKEDKSIVLVTFDGGDSFPLRIPTGTSLPLFFSDIEKLAFKCDTSTSIQILIISE